MASLRILELLEVNLNLTMIHDIEGLSTTYMKSSALWHEKTVKCGSARVTMVKMVLVDFLNLFNILE